MYLKYRAVNYELLSIVLTHYVRKHIYSFTFQKVGVVSAKYLRSLDSDPKQPWTGNERPQMLHRP